MFAQGDELGLVRRNGRSRKALRESRHTVHKVQFPVRAEGVLTRGGVHEILESFQGGIRPQVSQVLVKIERQRLESTIVVF